MAINDTGLRTVLINFLDILCCLCTVCLYILQVHVCITASLGKFCFVLCISEFTWP